MPNLHPPAAAAYLVGRERAVLFALSGRGAHTTRQSEPHHSRVPLDAMAVVVVMAVVMMGVAPQQRRTRRWLLLVRIRRRSMTRRRRRTRRTMTRRRRLRWMRQEREAVDAVAAVQTAVAVEEPFLAAAARWLTDASVLLRSSQLILPLAAWLAEAEELNRRLLPMRVLAQQARHALLPPWRQERAAAAVVAVVVVDGWPDIGDRAWPLWLPQREQAKGRASPSPWRWTVSSTLGPAWAGRIRPRGACRPSTSSQTSFASCTHLVCRPRQLLAAELVVAERPPRCCRLLPTSPSRPLASARSM